MKIANLSASEQWNCCYECLYYGLNSFSSYSFKIILKIASTISRRRPKKKKPFVFTSGVFQNSWRVYFIKLVLQASTAVPLSTRCFYKSMQASKSARYMKFGVIATLAIKNAIFLSMKLYSLVKIIRSHRRVPPQFSEQTRFFCMSYMSNEKRQLMTRGYFTKLY
jgi:hypothetical protein